MHTSCVQIASYEEKSYQIGVHPKDFTGFNHGLKAILRNLVGGRDGAVRASTYEFGADTILSITATQTWPTAHVADLGYSVSGSYTLT